MTWMDRKLAALDTLVSQFFEGGAPWRELAGTHPLAPTPPAAKHASARCGKDSRTDRWERPGDTGRNCWSATASERGDKVQHAEAFELCEYGSQPGAAEMLQAVPVLAKAADFDIRTSMFVLHSLHDFHCHSLFQ